MPTQLSSGFAGFGDFSGLGAWRRRPEGDGEWNQRTTGGNEGGFYNPEPTPLLRTNGMPRATPTPTPRSSGSPRVQVINDRTERDLAKWNGRPMVETGIDINPSRSTGEPMVEAPSTPYQFDLDSAPSLFPLGAGSNSFDEWWKMSEPVTTGTATGQASVNSGGTIWGEAEGVMGYHDVTGDLSATAGVNAGGAGAEAEGGLETLTAEGTGIPVEPDLLPQDYEWTTSENDRRFLPEGESPEEEAPTSVAGGINFGGNSVSGFGGNMSLGAFLNMPLSSMHYGEGYPVSGGDVTYAGETEHTAGEDWRDNAAGRSENDGTGTTTINRGNDPAFETARLRATGQLSGGAWTTPSGMRIIGYDTASAAPIYEDANGNRFVNPGTGTTISGGSHYDYGQGRYVTNDNRTGAGFDSHAANLLLMGSQSGHNDKKIQMRVPDSGRNFFGTPSKGTGFIDDSGLLRRREGGSLKNDPWAGWSYDDQAADVERTQAAKARGFARGLPRGSGG